jgi:hypothetical protein
MIYALLLLAAVGVVGVLDVTFLRGAIGVKLSQVLPWARH